MNRNKKRKVKFKKRNPPFHWPLILLMIMIFEFVVLIQERAWSQNYVVTINKIRDQAENLSYQNQKLFENIYGIYDGVFKLEENNNYLVKAKREFVSFTKKLSFIPKSNNEE